MSSHSSSLDFGRPTRDPSGSGYPHPPTVLGDRFDNKRDDIDNSQRDNKSSRLETPPKIHGCQNPKNVKTFIAIALVVSALFAVGVYFLNQHYPFLTKHIGNCPLTYGAPVIGGYTFLLGISTSIFIIFISSRKPPQDISSWGDDFSPDDHLSSPHKDEPDAEIAAPVRLPSTPSAPPTRPASTSPSGRGGEEPVTMRVETPQPSLFATTRAPEEYPAYVEPEYTIGSDDPATNKGLEREIRALQGGCRYCKYSMEIRWKSLGCPTQQELEPPPDIDAPLRKAKLSQFTLLHLAVLEDDVETITALIEDEASPYVEDRWGNTAFHRVKSTEALRALLPKEAKKLIPIQKNRQEETPEDTIRRLCDDEALARKANSLPIWPYELTYDR